MPRRAVSCGADFVISCPSNRIVPSFGWRNPLTKLNTVVFPAPFGPITKTISPSFIVNDTFFTAASPPKRLETFRSSRIGVILLTPSRRPGAVQIPPARRYPRRNITGPCASSEEMLQCADDSLRHEQHHHNDPDPVEQQMALFELVLEQL